MLGGMLLVIGGGVWWLTGQSRWWRLDRDRDFN
jgi:hypothetical protein